MITGGLLGLHAWGHPWLGGSVVHMPSHKMISPHPSYLPLLRFSSSVPNIQARSSFSGLCGPRRPQQHSSAPRLSRPQGLRLLPLIWGSFVFSLLRVEVYLCASAPAAKTNFESAKSGSQLRPGCILWVRGSPGGAQVEGMNISEPRGRFVGAGRQAPHSLLYIQRAPQRLLGRGCPGHNSADKGSLVFHVCWVQPLPSQVSNPGEGGLQVVKGRQEEG